MFRKDFQSCFLQILQVILLKMTYSARVTIEPGNAQYQNSELRRRKLLALLTEAVASSQSTLPFPDEAASESVSAASGARDATHVPFTFIDLFSGIGGMRLGLEAVGGRCLLSCEIDAYARKTYHAWFGEDPGGDVMELSRRDDLPGSFNH